MSHRTSQTRGITPTPILVPFRFLKTLSFWVNTLVQELILLKNDGETKKPHQNWCRGITIIEIVVVVSILLFITGIIVSSHVGYNTNVYFSQASEDVMLALRQAQVYGVGGKKSSAGTCGVGNFECRYGVNFSMATPDRFTVFVDNNDNKFYDGADTLIDTNIFKSPIVLSSVECLPNIQPTGLGCTNDVLNITFKRPNPDAIINDTSDMTDPTTVGFNLGKVTITNGTKYSTTTISNAGQISLQ